MGVFDDVTVRIWHGGVFRNECNGELVYLGGQGRTFEVDPDQLCYWDLVDLAKKCGMYKKIIGVYYLVPGLSLVNGLRKAFDDKEVLEMADLAVKYRCIDAYVLHSDNEPDLEPMQHPIEQTDSHPLNKPPTQPGAKKLTPKRAPHKPLTSPTRCSPRKRVPISDNKFTADVAASSSLKDNTNLNSNSSKKTPSTIKEVSISPCMTHSTPSIHTNNSVTPHTTEIGNFFGEVYDDEEDDADFEEGLGFEHEESCGDDVDLELEEEEEEDIADEELVGDYSDTSDDEYRTARERVINCSIRLKEIAQQVVKNATEGRLGAQQTSQNVQTVTNVGGSGYISEYKDSGDEIHTPPDSGDEDEVVGRKKRGVLVSLDTDFSSFRWKVGQRFATRGHFKEAVTKYAIMQGRDLSIVVSNKNRQQKLGVKCENGCPFYLFSSWHSRKSTFLVRRVDEVHTCHRNMKKNRQLKSTWVAKQMLDVFKARPHWPAKEIMETVRRAYKIVVNRDFAYNIKYYAHKMLHGSMQEHYKKLGRYVEALKGASPNTELDLVTVLSKQDQPPVFQRLFTCFEGLQKGWKEGCRKVICVDACFLKTFLGGQLLCAVGRDGNDQMYPIAWAAVEGENNLSWEWFFIHLQKCLALGDGTGISIISDEHQAILNAVATVLPNAEHRHCARHIFALWHKCFRGDEMKLPFWKIAKAYNMADYNEGLDELTEINEDAATAFKGYNPKLFCRAFLDSSRRTDAITNNMAETFNGYIINARTKHMIYMLEDVRAALMQRLVLKRQEMQKSTSILCPRIQATLEKEKIKAADCDVLPSTDNLFNVTYYLDQLNVDLEARTCTCRKWDMLGIPCCHAIACIFFQNREAELFVDDCYKREIYLKAYAGSIPPCEGERHWPRVVGNLDPPPIKIGPGRPRKNRIKDPFENPKRPGTLTRVGMEMTCSICLVRGHNKRRCPNRDTAVLREPPPKRSRGRPRLDGAPPHRKFTSTATTTIASTSTAVINEHYSTTAQPSQLGRGGRMIRGGKGSRGGSGVYGDKGTGKGATECSRGRGKGRGRGRNQIPVGVGVYIADDGSAMTNSSGR